jgi:class 3 adenylate cyclase
MAGKTYGVADSWEHDQPDVRASDRDRDQTLESLRHHVTDGSLTLDEFADRVAIVLEARTRRDLVAVTADLPAPSPVPATSPAPAAATVPDGRRVSSRRWLVGIMSGGGAKGRWRVGRSVTAVAVMGHCEVDFRQAEIDAAEVRVTAFAVMGGVDVIVPEGIAVELTGFPIMGGKQLKVADVPILPGSPVIRVRAFPIMGGVGVRSKPNRPRGELNRNKGKPVKPSAVDPTEIAQILPGLTATEGLGASEGTVTIMFSDVAGYSALNERLGDLAAHDVLRAHNAIVREQVTVHGGQEVKTQGDGFMVAFSSATRGLRCAVAIQKAMDKYCTENPDEPIQLHIGLHTGEPIREGGDLLGRTVITASRLSDVARAGEILVSALLHELTDPTGEFKFGEPRRVDLKGISGSRTVYPVQWQG